MQKVYSFAFLDKTLNSIIVIHGKKQKKKKTTTIAATKLNTALNSLDRYSHTSQPVSLTPQKRT